MNYAIIGKFITVPRITRIHLFNFVSATIEGAREVRDHSNTFKVQDTDTMRAELNEYDL
jgi:hypothetical protein